MYVFIIEGWSDHDQLRLAYPGIETIVTNGIKFNFHIRGKVEDYIRKGYTPIILSDPDPAGDQLEKWVRQYYPEMVRVTVDPQQGCVQRMTRMKYGVEYCSVEYIRFLLGKYMDDPTPLLNEETTSSP